MVSFPAYDISDHGWNKASPTAHNILFENPYNAVVVAGNDEFRERIKKFRYVDSTGKIFRVVDFNILPNKGFLKFISFRKRIELEFEDTGEQFPFNQFKELLIHRANETDNAQLREKATVANSYSELFASFLPEA